MTSLAQRSFEAQTPAGLVALARAIAPEVHACAEAASRQRDLPPGPMEKIRAAGLLRMFQPARWGGLEADPRTYFEVENVLSEACASTGWVYGVLCVQSYVLGLFDEQAQADVWGADPTAVASSCFQALGVAQPVEGGYRLSGRWTFSSGSSFAQWALLGAKVAGEEPAGAGLAAIQLFLVPRAEFEIVDTWHTFGLRGTASNDILVKHAFVPAHRMLKLDPGIVNLTSKARPGPALYRLPWLYLFTSSISNITIGIARAALSAFLEINTKRIAGFTGKVAKDDPAVHNLAGRMRVAIDTVDGNFKRNVGILLDHIEADQVVPFDVAWLMRVEMCASARQLAALTDEMLLLLGGSGIREQSPFTRIWLDMMAARSHIGNDPTGAATMLGKMMLDDVAAQG